MKLYSFDFLNTTSGFSRMLDYIDIPLYRSLFAIVETF